MGRRDTVVIGGSAGGVDALRALVSGLPADLAASVLVVVHVPASARSRLPAILRRCGPLRAVHASGGERLEHGRIYVAPPDHHLLVGDDTVLLSRGPHESRARPAVDPLFRSAARWRGPRTIGVVLSGVLDDGAVGLALIDHRGGATLVQQPEDALFDGMPTAALAAAPRARALPAAGLGPAIADLVGQPVTDPTAAPDPDLLLEAEMAEHDEHSPRRNELPGRPVQVGCPDCGGGLSLLELAGTVHYRCHVGHTFSPQTLLAAQREHFESSLWAAVRYLEEQAAVHEELARRAGPGYPTRASADRFDAAERARDAVRVLRRQLEGSGDAPGHAG
jgi:two-component system chemotaxis response regulator CheB